MMKAVALLLIGILIIDATVVTYSFVLQQKQLEEAVANVSGLETQILTRNGELLTLRGTVGELQSRLADSNAKSSTLLSELAKIETNSAKLQQQVNTVKAVIDQVTGLPAISNPPYISVDNLTVTPNTVDVSSNVNVVVTIKNTGTQAGAYRILLEIREYSKQIYDDRGRDVVLGAGESRAVNFDIAFFDKGNYVLSVGNHLRDLVVK